MSEEKKQGWANAVIAVFALSIVGAALWEVFLPGAKAARIVGFGAFGILCIFLRVMPRKFLVPKPKK